MLLPDVDDEENKFWEDEDRTVFVPDDVIMGSLLREIDCLDVIDPMLTSGMLLRVKNGLEAIEFCDEEDRMAFVLDDVI